MDLRARMIQDYEQGESITALAEIYSVTRKTIYKWLERYEALGVAGLAEESRAPHRHPQAISEDVIQHVVDARRKWGWGPRNLLAKLPQQQPQVVWPAPSTVAELLRQRGLSHARKRRPRAAPGAVR